MKKILFPVLLIGLVAILPSIKAHAQGFEGTVYWTMSIPMLDEEKHEMKINIKGEKTESEMDMGVQGEIKSYTDRAKMKMYVVMQAMKMGFWEDINPDSVAGKDKLADVDLKPTGQKATIAGHPAEEYSLKSGEVDMSLWASGDFPKDIRESFAHAMGTQPGKNKEEGHAFKMLAEKGLVPVKVEARQAGQVAMSMEFVKYESKKLDDALFVPPSDIKFQPMPKGHGMN